MQYPTLLIETTDAYIGLRSHRPPLQIKQQPADLQIRQKHVDIVQISTTASKLYIDQTEAFADANLKSPLRMANEFWQKTEGKVLDYIAKVAREGNQLMEIEHGVDVIPEIAKQNSKLITSETTLAYMPRSMSQVKFHYEPGEVNFHVPFEQADITVNRRPPQINIPKWETNVYIRQQNSIHFEYVGNAVDRTL